MTHFDVDAPLARPSFWSGRAADRHEGIDRGTAVDGPARLFGLGPLVLALPVFLGMAGLCLGLTCGLAALPVFLGWAAVRLVGLWRNDLKAARVFGLPSVRFAWRGLGRSGLAGFCQSRPGTVGRVS